MMGAFPQDFPGLLIPVAITEGFSGILKSKFYSSKIFWTALSIEIICAGIQSTALIITVSRGIYSELVTPAPYMTVILDPLLLFVEALLVMKMRRTIVDITDATRGTALLSLVTAVILGLSGLPIFLAKVRRKKSLNASST